MMKRLMLIAAAVLIGLPLQGRTQPGPSDDDPPPIPPQRRERIEKRIQTMRMWKLTKDLDLSDDQATKFLPLMNEMDRKMEELRHNRQEAVRKLSDLSWDEKSKPDEINKLLDNLESMEEQQITLHKQFRKDVAGILKPDQVGRMVLFNLRFPEMVRESIRDYQEGRDRDMPPPPPPHGGDRWDW